ncbi:M23 family metallopeptidase [Chloroflexota bacterium]
MKRFLIITLIVTSIIFLILDLSCTPKNGVSNYTPNEEILQAPEKTIGDFENKANNFTEANEKDEDNGIEDLSLTAVPANPNDLAYIFPMGLMTNAHVTPVDHMYYYWEKKQAPLDTYQVYSPADGYITDISYLENDYRVIIEHSRDVYSIFIHLEQLSGPIAEFNSKVTWGQSAHIRIPVKVGEIIALDGGTAGFDYSLHDKNVVLQGFINPESYKAEPWKIHTVDPYDYFTEPARSSLLSKNIRQVTPLGGKIDYDVFGSLSGNWFVENTNGYMGLVDTVTPIKPDQQKGYWNTHLALAPDPIDPTITIVSFGWFEGRCAQQAIRQPNPIPANVSVKTGLVRYELWNWQYVHRDSEQPWAGLNRQMAKDIEVHFGHEMKGTVIFQMLDETHLKMEVFSGVAAKEVTGFTKNAVIYER